MSGRTKMILIIGLAVLALAAAGAFYGRALRAMLPDRLIRAPDTASGSVGSTLPAEVTILDIHPVRIPLAIEEDPRSITLSPSGAVWIAAGPHAVEVNGDGTVRSRVALPGPVSAIAFDADGNLIAALSNRIEVRTTRGAPIRSFADLDEKAHVVSIAIDRSTGEMFLADAGNAVVLRYSEAGRLLGSIGGFVVPSPYFPITVSADRRLYAANPGRHGIETYSYDGTLLESFYAPSMEVQGFAGCCNPACIALLAGGRVLTVEKGIGRIKIYAASGALRAVVADEEILADDVLGSGAVLDAGGRLLVLERSGRQMLAFSGVGP